MAGPDAHASRALPPLWLRAFLALASGAVVVLVFPPFGFWQLALLAWIPFLVAVAGASPRVSFRIGLLFGMAAYAGTLIWLWEVFRWPAIGLWLILGSFVGVFAAWFGSRSASTRAALWFGPLAATLWTGIEYFRCEWFSLRFPWITPGTGLPPTPLTPVIGAYGTSFLILLGAVWLVSGRAASRLAGALVLTSLLVMTIRGTNPASLPPGEEIRVALVQCEEGFFDDYYDLTLSVDERVDAIVWPEYALDYDVRKNPRDMERIETLFPNRASILVLGSQSFLPAGRRHNTAVTIGADGVLGQHHKNRPVHFFDDGLAGKSLDSFATPVGTIATPVCFDCDYTEVARKLVLDGAELILAPSMDARRWTARQHEQHAQLFRHRAAENARWIAVAATSGVTQIIDPHGTVIRRLEGMDPGVLLGEVGLESRKTIYTRYGWTFGPLCSVAAVLILAGTLGRWAVRVLKQRRSTAGT